MTISSRTKVTRSKVTRLASDVSPVEGMLMVDAMESGVLDGAGVVVPSIGAAGEKIAGFARFRPASPSVRNRIEFITVPATSPYTATFTYTPITPLTRSSFVTTGGTVITPVAQTVTDAGPPIVYSTPGATEAQIVGNTITFNVAQAGKTVRVAYTYSVVNDPSATLYNSDLNSGGWIETGYVELITEAPQLYTNVYDPASNWTAGAAVYAGANGEVTQTSSSRTLIKNCYVIETPSAENRGFLGLFISV